MSSLKSISLSLILFTSFVLPFNAFADHSIPHKIETLQKQIASLRAQLEALYQARTLFLSPQTHTSPASSASSEQFTQDLYFGLTNNVEVRTLQQFLTNQEVYSGPITGNFFSLTREAVKKFQAANSIPSTGYFGPLSRRAASGPIDVVSVAEAAPYRYMENNPVCFLDSPSENQVPPGAVFVRECDGADSARTGLYICPSGTYWDGRSCISGSAPPPQSPRPGPRIPGAEVVESYVPIKVLPPPPPAPPPVKPAEPTMTREGSAWTGFGVPGAGEIKIRGNYGYLTPGEGDFQILDLSNKQNPRIIGKVAVGFKRAIEVSGNYAYLGNAGNPGGIDVVDISSPVAPRKVADWTPPPGAAIGKIKAWREMLFVTLYPDTDDAARTAPAQELDYDFVVLNIRNAPTIQQITQLKTSDRYGAFQLSDCYQVNTAVCRFSVGMLAGGIAIVDFESPNTLRRMGTYMGEAGENKPYLLQGGLGGDIIVGSLNPQISEYFIRNILFGRDLGISFVNPAQSYKITRVDISNLARPIPRGNYQFIGQPMIWSAEALGQNLYVVDEGSNRLLVFNTALGSNAEPIRLVNQITQTEPSQMTTLSRDSSYLYVNEIGYGIRVYSLAGNSINPQYIGGVPTAAEGRYAWVNDEQTYAYIMESNGGTRIHIIDVSNKSNPVKRGFYWNGVFNSYYTQFVGRGNYLYVPSISTETGEISVEIIDVSNPDTPRKISSFPNLRVRGEVGPRIALSGNYAYITTPENLSIYDISQPRTPVFLSSLNLLTATNPIISSPQIFADSRFAYVVATDENKFFMVNIENPRQPQITGQINNQPRFAFRRTAAQSAMGEYDGRIAVANGYAYILSGEDYGQTGPDGKLQLFHIINVQNPANPVYVRGFDDYTGVDYLLNQGPRSTGDQWLNDVAVAPNQNYLYFSAYWPLIVYDISDPTNPQYVTDSFRANVRDPFGSGQAAGWSLGRMMITGEQEARFYAPVIQGLNIIKITRIPPSTGPVLPVSNVINPGANIQAAIDSNPEGATFTLKSGKHFLESRLVPKQGQKFIGEPGAVISGARLLTEFQREGSYWVATGQTQETSIAGECLPGNERCNYSNDLFFDNQPMRHVARLSEVRPSGAEPGTWYFDYDNDKIYFADNPNGRTVEVSTTDFAFSANAPINNVTIKGLVIEKFANPAQSGAINTDGETKLTRAAGWVIEDNEIRFNHGGGISFGDRARILRNNIHRNGQLGIGGIGDNVLVEGNEISYNNFAVFQPSWEAGGTKFWDTRNLMVRGNRVRNNNGPGLWTDFNNINTTYENNIVEYDYFDPGIYHEISYSAVIRNNKVSSNGRNGTAIRITNSKDVEIYGNEVDDGIVLEHDETRVVEGGGGKEVKNVTVRGNTVRMRGSTTGLTQDGGSRNIFTNGGIRFTGNTYYAPGIFLWDDKSIFTPSEWQSYGHDLDGKFYNF